ncbi:MAG: manganese-dependent ADP-ribose/CDP-alcohol diphosphatase-like protein [Monoraphidium minutum]|nr:MAG: manganese-dependent ADP-ribose/CDP-alcohol diphosphatase-like protein [Monoraphidium minutum]
MCSEADMFVDLATGGAAGGGPPPEVLFKIGLVADVQYADVEDAISFHGQPRYYKNSLLGLRRALAAFASERVSLALNLGDSVDGKQRAVDPHGGFDEVLACFEGRPYPSYHLIGNHDLYNLPRPEANKRLGIAPAGPYGSSYYSLVPHPSTRLVVLDSYELSLLDAAQGPDHPLRIEAERVMAVNPNANRHSPEGLEGAARRFVEFGGGAAAAQVAWLVGELAAAKAAGQRVIVAGHIPFCPGTAPEPCLLWNYEEVLDIMEASGVVAATLAGHAHMNGYALRNGIHHVVLPSLLETPPERDAYAVLDVTPSGLVLRGHDAAMSLHLRFAAPGGGPLGPPMPLSAIAPWAAAARSAGRLAAGGKAAALEVGAEAVAVRA